MSEELHYGLGELDRRLGNVLREGPVVGVDFSVAGAPRVRVDVGDLVTDWLPWLAPRAGRTRVWNPPSIGEQVAILSAGDPSQGVVLPGGIFQDAHQANGSDPKDTRVTFQDGSVVEFDDVASVLHVQVAAAGSVRVNIGGTTLQLQDGHATLTAAAITLDGAVTITNGAAIAGTLTNNGTNVGSTHHHPDAQGGFTGTPS